MTFKHTTERSQRETGHHLTLLRMISPRHVTDGLLKGTDAAQAAQYVAMEKATAAEVLKHQEETVHVPGQSVHSSIGGPGDVKSEVVPVSTMTVHHAQSSPVVMQPSQHSSALLNAAQNLSGGTGSHTASSTAITQEATSAPQSAPAPQSPQTPMNGSSMQSLFIEEIHSVSAKNRAVSIEVESDFHFSYPMPSLQTEGLYSDCCIFKYQCMDMYYAHI